MFRSSLLRAGVSTTTTTSISTSTPFIRQALRAKSSPCLYTVTQVKSPWPQRRHASAQAHAISNPTLANIEKRWEAMPPQEQADLWMQLRDRMKSPWNEMTLQEKKAAYWIAFGPHGPRALPPPDETFKIVAYTAIGVAVAFVLIFAVRQFARPPPSTMNKEWQEQTNEFLKAQNVEPISGISSEGYVGPGQVQSKPKKKE